MANRIKDFGTQGYAVVADDFEATDGAAPGWRGECFVFDNRVTVDHRLQRGHYDQCHACRMPISDEGKQHPHYQRGISCPHCFGQKDAERTERLEEREKQIALARLRGEPHIGADAAQLKAQRRPLKHRP